MRFSLQRRRWVIILIILAYFYSEAKRSSSTGMISARWMINKGSTQTIDNEDSDDFNAEHYVDYEITTTNYGWNTRKGHEFSRRIISGEFFNATLAHPRYNASAWDDLEKYPDPTRRIIAFMDIDTCVESNYPVYANPDWRINVENEDTGNHPHHSRSIFDIVEKSCQHLIQASTSPAVTSHKDSRLIILDCSPMQQFHLEQICKDRRVFRRGQVMVAYYNVMKENARSWFDVGLPPPAIKPVELNAAERGLIKSCAERKYLFSFQGRNVANVENAGREKLMAFQDDPEFYVRVFDHLVSTHNGTEYNKMNLTQEELSQARQIDTHHYKSILKNSVFAGAPRGDSLFSYRFSEILSAGSIPVVYADGWLPPFNDKLINWTKCAVFILESDYDRTAEILREIPAPERCSMQRCALKVWDRFASTRAGWVRGLVDVALSSTSYGVHPGESLP